MGELLNYFNEMIKIAKRGKRRAWIFRLRGWFLYAIKRKLNKRYMGAYIRHLLGKATREDYIYELYHKKTKARIISIEYGYYKNG